MVHNMDLTAEALKIWDALRPMIDKEINDKTASCPRAKKMKVTSAPDGSVLGVAEPYGDTHYIPYSSSLSNVSVGESVWVWWFFNNAATMIALSYGDGQISNPFAVSSEAPRFYVDLASGQLVYRYPAGAYAADSFSMTDGSLFVNDGGNYPESAYSINANQALILNY